MLRHGTTLDNELRPVKTRLAPEGCWRVVIDPRSFGIARAAEAGSDRAVSAPPSIPARGSLGKTPAPAGARLAKGLLDLERRRCH